MNIRTVSRNVGYALLVSALFMLLSSAVALFDSHDSSFGPLMVSFLITFIVGIFPFIFVRRTSAITLREGYVIIVLSWLLSFVFGMLPYALWGGPFTVDNAWFESVSGFTTTGATILDDIEALPKGLLFWRASTHFIGGLGVVVFLLLLIPNSSPIRMRLTNMELSSLTKGAYSIQSNKVVYIFAYVYLGLFVLAFLLYWIAGMSAFDAVCHAFSVCASGGFSTRNLSIAAFNSPLIELITMVLMFLTSIHFGLVFLCFVTRSFRPLNNPILRFYVITLVVFILMLGISLRLSGLGYSLGKSMWYSAFQTLCFSSTTGFGIVDNAQWPLYSNMLLLILAVMCGCAGSTTGGVKADRILMLFKAIGRQINRVLHPSSVNEVRLGNKVLGTDEVSPHILYLAMYATILVLSTLAALATGVDGHSAFAASVTSLGNVGPAIGELGTMGSFNGIPSACKFIFTMDMFLGRIELYPALAVVAMIFDGRKR